MKISNFTLLLILAIFMVIGAALLPSIDVADQPRPRQGKTLYINYGWANTSAKVVEQNVTSSIEGLVSSVKGVESVSSESFFGGGMVIVQLKKDVDVSSVKFEISSLLKQVYKKLPEGVSYPELSGGEVVNDNAKSETIQQLLSYQVNSNLSDEQLKEYIERKVEPELKRIEDVKRVAVTGGVSKYIQVNYDPFVLANYHLSASDVEQGIRAFMGREDIVGELIDDGKRLDLLLTTDKFSKPLEEIPIGNVDGKTVYLNDLATYEYKNREPESYYRVNGLNTIYLNIFVDAQANKIKLSHKIRNQIKELESQLTKGVYLTLIYDAAKARESELHKVVWRSLMALLILLVFVWFSKRQWKYLLVMVLTLVAIILTAVIAYWLFDIRLHVYSLAGITVSLGLVIDASVVMTDHYSYYRNRKAFLAIFAALLTTIGSLVVVFWLPEHLQKDLSDFALIIIVNLSVALVVAYAFTPALIDKLNYRSYQQGQIRNKALIFNWSRVYTRYINFTQKRKWIYILLIIMAFGIPFHALPAEWEGHDFYNQTIGSPFFQTKCKDLLANIFGGSMRLFAQAKSSDSYNPYNDREIRLIIRGQMPLGGSVTDLNEKVIKIDNFLSQFNQIERFVTDVSSRGAIIEVDFKDEYKYSSFPYLLENKVIGQLVSIGGADWETHGVSERGFSNSLRLQYRQHSIKLTGYNYERLYRFAEDMCETLKQNHRVTDIIIQTPGREFQEDEFFMRYDKQKMALYNFDVNSAYDTMNEILSGRQIAHFDDGHMSADIDIKSMARDKFDLWHLNNAYIKVNNNDVKLSDFMAIERREAKNSIPKRNQEYQLNVSFNVLASWSYTAKLLDKTIKQCNDKMPVGYHCEGKKWSFDQEQGTQYWLILLIAVIIFFICAILFESLRLPIVIVSLIPVSFIGTFLIYVVSGVEFGTGGFASLVLLSGLTVNGGIYIINEYKNTIKRFTPRTRSNMIHLYVRAYNHKIVAVMLTILSTVLGLIPFFVDGNDEEFWFSFAVGSAGGLLFSVIAIIFVMPIFMKFRDCPVDEEEV